MASDHPEPSLGDILSRVIALEARVATLTEKLEAWFERQGERDSAPVVETGRGAASFPRSAQGWEQELPRLFGDLLPPSLVPVCARFVMGLRAKEIAADLNRPLSSVKSQIVSIRERLDLLRSDEIPLHVCHRLWEVSVIQARQDARSPPKG